MRQWLKCIEGYDATGLYRGPLRIVGSARCVWEDLQAAPFPKAPIMALNWTGIFLREALHWASIHREICAPIVTARDAFHRPVRADPLLTHAWKKPAPGVHSVWFGDVAPDFTGCFSVMLALTLGYSPIILCGVPMDTSGHYYDAIDVSHKDLSPTNDSWYMLAREHANDIHSMSGWTRKLFDAARKGQVLP